jgi:hypothetical protein
MRGKFKFQNKTYITLTAAFKNQREAAAALIPGPGQLAVFNFPSKAPPVHFHSRRSWGGEESSIRLPGDFQMHGHGVRPGADGPLPVALQIRAGARRKIVFPSGSGTGSGAGVTSAARCGSRICRRAAE